VCPNARYLPDFKKFVTKLATYPVAIEKCKKWKKKRRFYAMNINCGKHNGNWRNGNWRNGNCELGIGKMGIGEMRIGKIGIGERVIGELGKLIPLAKLSKGFNRVTVQIFTVQ